MFISTKDHSKNYYLVMVGLDADLDEALDHFKCYTSQHNRNIISAPG